MKSEEIKSLLAKFEQAASELEGIECWSARELQPLLGYSKWENFEKVLAKAKEACKQAGTSPTDHFPDVRKVIDAGKGAQISIQDVALSRYECYLVAQNGDSRKPEIAFAVIRSKGDQTLFHLSTQLLKRKLGVPENRPLAEAVIKEVKL